MSVDPIKALQAKLERKTQEKELLRLQIQSAKLDAQMTSLHLLARGVGDKSVIPADILTGGKIQAPDAKWIEHKRLLEWLAENCDLSTKQAFNVPVPELSVGDHHALLGHMLQWRLVVQGEVKLSVPFEAEEELTEIFRKTKLGLLGTEELEEFAEHWMLVTTDLLADNVATPALFLIHEESRKAIVVSSWPNISVPEEPLPPTATFDPIAFFNHPPASSLPMPLRSCPLVEVAGGNNPPQQLETVFIGTSGDVNKLSCPAADSMQWTRECGPMGAVCRPIKELGVRFSQVSKQFTLLGPFGFTVIAHPLPGQLQHQFVCRLVALALEHGVRVRRCTTPVRSKTVSLEEIKVTAPSWGDSEEATALSCDDIESSGPAPAAWCHARRVSWSSGDRVGVERGGWLQGVLQGTQDEVAHVQCDVDESGDF